MIVVEIKGVTLRLETGSELFSPRAVDRGTLAMLSRVEIGPGDKVLDLGCGYGVVGILAAKLGRPEQVWMLDNDPLAIRIATSNAAANDVAGVHVVQSDGLRALDEAGFTLILCNPPYQTDFATPKHFIEKGFNRLTVGGRLVMVTKRELWYRRKLAAIFGGVRVEHIDGYVVFEAVRRRARYANRPALSKT